MFSGLTSYFFGSSESTENPEPSDSTTTEQTQETAQSRLKPQPCDNTTDSSQEQTQHCHLKTSSGDDDEWVIVDKSSGGPHNMETNPLENLLIEHPSMSVYGPRGRQNSTGVDSMHSESSDDVDMAAVPQPSTRGQQSMVSPRHPPRRARTITAHAGLASIRSEKSVRVSERRYNTRNMAKSSLRRCNKVHEVNGRGKTAHRRDHRINQPAGRANNRRC